MGLRLLVTVKASVPVDLNFLYFQGLPLKYLRSSRPWVFPFCCYLDDSTTAVPDGLHCGFYLVLSSALVWSRGNGAFSHILIQPQSSADCCTWSQVCIFTSPSAPSAGVKSVFSSFFLATGFTSLKLAMFLVLSSEEQAFSTG